MGPMVGIPKSKRLQYHILRKCKKYQTSKAPSRPAPSTATPSVPPTASSASVQANMSYRTQRDAVKPKPRACKKKGPCNHVIAFGDHYDRQEWKIYEEFLSNQSPETNIANN